MSLHAQKLGNLLSKLLSELVHRLVPETLFSETYLGDVVCRHEARVNVNNLRQGSLVAVSDTLCKVPSWKVGDDAIGGLRGRSMPKLGLSR